MTANDEKKRIYLLTALLLCFFVLLLANPDKIIESGQKAVDLCLNIIIPSLLPFFVVSRLILNTGAIRTISRIFEPVMKPIFNLPGSAAFPLVAGWLSGYPAGAKYTTDLYKKQLLTLEESQRLLAFCNNSGPLFIVGAVGVGYFGSSKVGLILLICHILASITVGFGIGLFSRKKEKASHNVISKTIEGYSPLSGRILTEAIIDSMTILLQISATIIFFAVLVQTLDNIGLFSLIGKIFVLIAGPNDLYVDVLKIFFAGSCEITYGLYLLSLSTVIPLPYKVLLTGFLCGFGGFSVHTQVTGLCPAAFRLKYYFWGKVFHGLTALIYTGLFLMNRSIPVASHPAGISYHLGYSQPLSLAYILFALVGIFLVVKYHPDKRK